MSQKLETEPANHLRPPPTTVDSTAPHESFSSEQQQRHQQQQPTSKLNSSNNLGASTTTTTTTTTTAELSLPSFCSVVTTTTTTTSEKGDSDGINVTAVIMQQSSSRTNATSVVDLEISLGASMAGNSQQSVSASSVRVDGVPLVERSDPLSVFDDTSDADGDADSHNSYEDGDEGVQGLWRVGSTAGGAMLSAHSPCEADALAWSVTQDSDGGDENLEEEGEPRRRSNAPKRRSSIQQSSKPALMTTTTRSGSTLPVGQLWEVAPPTISVDTITAPNTLVDGEDQSDDLIPSSSNSILGNSGSHSARPKVASASTTPLALFSIFPPVTTPGTSLKNSSQQGSSTRHSASVSFLLPKGDIGAETDAEKEEEIREAQQLRTSLASSTRQAIIPPSPLSVHAVVSSNPSSDSAPPLSTGSHNNSASDFKGEWEDLTGSLSDHFESAAGPPSIK